MNKANDLITTYVSDMLAFERSFCETLERQAREDRVRTLTEASRVIEKVHNTIQAHSAAIDEHLKTLGGKLTSNVKEAVVLLAGMAAGVLDKIRPHSVHKMRRD